MPVKIASRIRLRQRGVSIVEALVALVILSVGMLGIAGLYLLSVQSNRTAQTRTAAVHLINDMADRLRTNAAAMGSYALTLGAVPPVAGKDCSTEVCTPAQVAAYDLRAWYDSAMIALPVGSDGAKPRVGIAYTAGATTADPARLVITTGWKEPGSTDELTTSLEVVQLGSKP
jgi:type IV pilus assembly protein PilV